MTRLLGQDRWVMSLDRPFEFCKRVGQQRAPRFHITQAGVERGRSVSMTKQPATEHDIHEVWPLGGAAGEIRTAGDDLRRRGLAGARINAKHHRVIVPMLLLIKVSDVTQHPDQAVLEAMSLVGP